MNNMTNRSYKIKIKWIQLIHLKTLTKIKMFSVQIYSLQLMRDSIIEITQVKIITQLQLIEILWILVQKIKVVIYKITEFKV
jgi:hypothetical protein